MKKILIGLDSLNAGGEEKSAIAMLQELTPDKYDITVLLVRKEGEFVSLIPPWVKVREIIFTKDGELEFFQGLKRALLSYIKHFRFFRFFCTLFRRLKLLLLYTGKNLHIIKALEFKKQIVIPSDINNFDIAMAYTTFTPMHYIIAQYIKAKKKITWLHCELSSNKQLKEQQISYTIFRKHFDIWAGAGSDFVLDEYRKYFPKYEERMIKFPCFYNKNECLEKSWQGKGFTKSAQEIILFSAGRLMPQKGFDIAVQVMKRLIDAGYNLKWYIAGKGAEENNLRRLIAKNHLEDRFILMGVKKNPYPYFRTCNIYVQPSRFEGFCITLAEAKIFCRPIVATEFAGAREQLIHNQTGKLCYFSVEKLFNSIRDLLDHPEQQMAFQEKLKEELNSPLAGSEAFFNILNS
jgi:capsular polysaccharide biosynthesis protein